MAAEGEGGLSRVRGKEVLHEIEVKVRKWWEDKKVFTDGCEKPGGKFFGEFPFASFMGNPFSLSVTNQSGDLPEFPVDVMRFALVYVCDEAVDQAKIEFLLGNVESVYSAANVAIQKFNEELSWYEEFVAADFESSLRHGEHSTFADKVFSNEIKYALNRTKEKYEAGLFRGALDSIFELQDARDWYKVSCGATDKMNRDLVWRFMEVQTCLISPICPHYAEYVWKDFLGKCNFVVHADWPITDDPDEPNIRSASKYLALVIGTMKSHLTTERNRKSTTQATTSLIEESQNLEALIHVNEAGDTLSFKQNGNEQSMKVKFWDACLDLKPPYRKKLLIQNLGFIKRETGLHKVRVLYASKTGGIAKAGSCVKFSDAESSAPGIAAILPLTLPREKSRPVGASKAPRLKVDLSSSGSTPRGTNPLSMLWSLWSKPKSKDSELPQEQLPELPQEQLSIRERYYPEKCHGNPASMYHPPSKLLFQGSFHEALDAACNQDKWLLVNIQRADNFSSHMLNHHIWSEKTFCEIIATNLIFWQEYFDTPEGDIVSEKYFLDSRPVVVLIDPMTGEAMCTWNGMVHPDDYMEDLVPYLVSSPKNSCEPEEETELLACEFSESMKLETSSEITSKAEQDQKEKH